MDVGTEATSGSRELPRLLSNCSLTKNPQEPTTIVPYLPHSFNDSNPKRPIASGEMSSHPRHPSSSAETPKGATGGQTGALAVVIIVGALGIRAAGGDFVDGLKVFEGLLTFSYLYPKMVVQWSQKVGTLFSWQRNLPIS